MKGNMMRTTILLISLTAVFQDSECSSFGSVVTIDVSTKKSIVDTHNALRAQISNAANMRKLAWDEELAQRCQNVASYCSVPSYEQDVYASLTGDSGENIIWDPYNENVTADTVEVGVQEWYAQKEACETGESNFNHTRCVQYLRLAWAENDKIGCGAATCPFIDTEIGATADGLMFCCAYGPVKMINESQYEDPKNIFLPGESCSKCDENYGCDEKLCVSCHESPSACATTTPVTTSPQQSTGNHQTASHSSSTTSGSLRVMSSTIIFTLLSFSVLFLIA